MNKWQRRYNECVIRHLEANKIDFKKLDKRAGYEIQVNDQDFSQAIKVIGKISYKYPQYPNK